MDRKTEQLVDYALGVSFEAMDPNVVRETKARILDALGCVAGAAHHPVSEKVCRLAARYTMDRNATVFATGDKSAPEMAAFANSVMIRVLDLSDAYRVKSGGHPSDLMGACFAAAETAGSSGKELIAAIALGYEVYCAFTEAADFNIQGWDQPVYCIVASALAAGRLLGHDRDAMGHAVALAIVPNMAMYQTRMGELSAWKGCAGPNAARNGLFAALLAEEGFTGPEQPFDGKYGFCDFTGPFDLPLTPGEAPWRIAETNLKAFPICYQGQTAAWTALEMRDRFAVGDIEKVRVETYKKAVMTMADEPNRWAPKTRETADHSMPYVVGQALLQGAIGEEAFQDDALQAPDITALMQRIDVVENAEMTANHPLRVPCRITVTLQDGSEVTHELPYPKGHAKSPMSEAEVTDKFHRLYAVYGDTGHADAVVQAVA
jgi:2-methylcitrate dehydratase